MPPEAQNLGSGAVSRGDISMRKLTRLQNLTNLPKQLTDLPKQMTNLPTQLTSLPKNLTDYPTNLAKLQRLSYVGAFAVAGITTPIVATAASQSDTVVAPATTAVAEAAVAQVTDTTSS